MSFNKIIEKSLFRWKHLLWIFLFISVFAVISALIPWNDNLVSRIIWGIIFLSWTSFFNYILTWTAQSNYGQLPSRFYYRSGRKELFVVLLITVGIIGVGLLFSVFSVHNETFDVWDAVKNTITKDVGAPFTIIIGIASLFGLFLTFQLVGKEKREINGSSPKVVGL